MGFVSEEVLWLSGKECIMITSYIEDVDMNECKVSKRGR
jgi:hypothetical protein